MKLPSANERLNSRRRQPPASTRAAYPRVKLDGAIRREHQFATGVPPSAVARAHETVHHRNGVRHDNRLSDLELWAKPHPPGQCVADLVAWVVREYPEEVRALLGRRRDVQG